MSIILIHDKGSDLSFHLVLVISRRCIVINKIEVTKDRTIGKVIETAGKIANDKELEFTGKFRELTAEVKDQVFDVKEDVFQEGNELMDHMKEK